jgi:hypothetical protein
MSYHRRIMVGAGYLEVYLKVLFNVRCQVFTLACIHMRASAASAGSVHLDQIMQELLCFNSFFASHI